MAEETIIYHNPRCRKSRETLALIREKGVEPRIVEYLKEMPSSSELKLILAKLNLSVEDVLRKGEAIFKEKFKGKSFNEAEWLEIIQEYPKLLERPIVVKGSKAAMGRPPENVNKLF